MRDMPTQRYMFPVDGEPVIRLDDRPREKRDSDHEARKLLAGEIEAAIMFNNKHVCNPGKLTPEDRGVLAQAIRAQAARKRPRSGKLSCSNLGPGIVSAEISKTACNSRNILLCK
jgi:hypothetical protein